MYFIDVSTGMATLKTGGASAVVPQGTKLMLPHEMLTANGTAQSVIGASASPLSSGHSTTTTLLISNNHFYHNASFHNSSSLFNTNSNSSSTTSNNSHDINSHHLRAVASSTPSFTSSNTLFQNHSSSPIVAATTLLGNQNYLLVSSNTSSNSSINNNISATTNAVVVPATTTSSSITTIPTTSHVPESHTTTMMNKIHTTATVNSTSTTPLSAKTEKLDKDTVTEQDTTDIINQQPETSSTTTQQVAPLQSSSEPAEEDPEIDIVINNVVCSFSVRCHLNLRTIALNGYNVEFRRENGMVTMKLRKPYTTASIWSSGKITCTGATSEDNVSDSLLFYQYQFYIINFMGFLTQAKVAARRYARMLQKLGFRTKFNNFRVVNVLGTCSMPWAIKITHFSERYRKEASYEPELHPGVTYKLKEPKATLKIFSTGSITVTGKLFAVVYLFYTATLLGR